MSKLPGMTPFLLRLFREVVLADPAYIARLARHYAMVKQADKRPTSEPLNPEP
ncbi:MAG: hypothetical protein HY360_15815 [Verrucomicrobia bacterium]|nr:hypothetical protein [Verrucomicrobiota bacterium]